MWMWFWSKAESSGLKSGGWSLSLCAHTQPQFLHVQKERSLWMAVRSWPVPKPEEPLKLPWKSSENSVWGWGAAISTMVKAQLRSQILQPALMALKTSGSFTGCIIFLHHLSYKELVNLFTWVLSVVLANDRTQGGSCGQPPICSQAKQKFQVTWEPTTWNWKTEVRSFVDWALNLWGLH